MWRNATLITILLLGRASSGVEPTGATTKRESAAHAKSSSRQFSTGVVSIRWNPEALGQFGGEVVALDKTASDVDRDSMQFELTRPSTVIVTTDDSGSINLEHAYIRAAGACMMSIGDHRIPFGNPHIAGGGSDAWTIRDTLAADPSDAMEFRIESIFWEGLQTDGSFQLVGEMFLSRRWAERLGVTGSQDVAIGGVTVSATIDSDLLGGDENQPQRPGGGANDREAAAGRSSGPDVIVGALQSVVLYGNNFNGIAALAVGTTS